MKRRHRAVIAVSAVGALAVPLTACDPYVTHRCSNTFLPSDGWGDVDRVTCTLLPPGTQQRAVVTYSNGQVSRGGWVGNGSGSDVYRQGRHPVKVDAEFRTV